MFFAAIVCCAAATLSLFVKTLSFVLLIFSLAVFAFIIYKKNYKFIIVFISVFLVFISILLQFAKIRQIDVHDGEVAKGSFLVSEDIVNYDKFNMITLETVKCDIVSNNIKILTFDYKKNELKCGDIVEAELKISAISVNDEYRLSDYGNGIYATASIKNLNKTNRQNLFYKTAGSIRRYVKQNISSEFSGDVAGLLCALTTGDKTLIGDEFSHNVKTSGISHIVVVSGMHLSIIMSAIFFAVDRLFYNKYLRSVLSVAVIICITAICGFTMSVIRAGVTFIIAGFAPVFNRDNDSLSSLLTAITAILISTPFAIVNISFLLSVLSTLAIIWAVPFYSKLLFVRFKITSQIFKKIIQLFLCCVFANIFTLPVSIKTFGYISLVSPLTNLLITFPVTLALTFNIIAVALSAIPVVNFFGGLCFEVAGLCSRFIVFMVNEIASLRITVAVLPESAFGLSLCIVAAVIAFMYYYEQKLKRKELI